MREAGPRSDDAESSGDRSGTEFVGMVPTRSDHDAGRLLGRCLLHTIDRPDTPPPTKEMK